MRDLSQVERELREYERKIQRLKQLERELNSLDTKGFENEVRSIKSKIKNPDKVNQVERENSKLKQKIEVKERRTKEAVKAIDTAKSALQKAKGFNLVVSDAERLLNEAKSLLGKGDYITAIQRANKSKGIAEAEIDKKFKHLREETLNAISKAQSTLQNMKKLGINTKSEEEKLNNAKLELDEKLFSYATKLANQCKNSLEQKINEYKKAAERSAKQSLDFAYSKMKEGEKLGINVSDAQDLHRKAISKFDRREYEKAIDYSENCKKAAEDEISRYNHAKEQIRASKDIVENVKRVVPIPKVTDLIKNAEAALEIGNYNSAFKLAKQAEGEALKFKQDHERYKETSEFISSVESEIKVIKSSGVIVLRAVELIENAKTELNKNNFENAKESANKAKKIATERKSKYDSAFKSISEAERVLNETKNKGVIISTDLLTKSKQAFDNGDYEESIRSAQELKNLVNNTEIKYREARDKIKSARYVIEKVGEFCCNVLEVENPLNKADSAFNNGNYTDAAGYAKQAEETAKRIREESKPEITIKLSETSFKPNVWKRIDLIFKNNGTATAKEINVEYPKERIEIEDLTEIKELNPKEEKKLRIGLRSIHTGEVPLKTKIRYKDLDNKEYKEEKTFWITVGEEAKEYKKEQIEIIIERTIYDPCKGDFIEGRLPRMKEWINRYDPGAYWLAISIQNNTDRAIEEWDVDLETSSALKIKEAKIEGIEREIPHEAHLKSFKISVPEAHGTTIPKGGAQRVYFKLRADKPKTTYEISGVFKSEITGEVPIRVKEFKYLCDAGSLRKAILEQPEVASIYERAQFGIYYSPGEVEAIVDAMTIVSDIREMCTSLYPKLAEVKSGVEHFKGYLQNVENKLGQSYNDFETLVREMDAVLFEKTVPEDYAEKIKRKCLDFRVDLATKLQRQSIERGG